MLADLKITKFDEYGGVGIMSAYCSERAKKCVVLVGSNPGKQSPDCSAFHPATKSRQFVDKWFEDTDYHIIYMNLVDYKTEGNKQLKKSDLCGEKIYSKFLRWKENDGAHIVACGKTATMGLTMGAVPHFEMPHPSGLCRFWNDKEAGEDKVKEMLAWLKN